MNVVSIDNLSFSYEKQTILSNISLDAKEHDFLAIIGPNGGGKSTLLKLILGILSPDKGTLEVFGKSPALVRADIGYVSQNTNINTDFPIKVLDVVLIGNPKGTRSIFGYSKEEKRCALDALEQVGMTGYEHHKIGSLSGGQRQRVMIARAICSRPRLLILDEPTASIDAAGQKEIYDLLKELNKKITIIVVSHDISVILGYANKAAYINNTLTYHDISDKNHIFHTHDHTDHLCEIDILEMLGGESCEVCNDCEEESR
jgi:zinc transport system ATP-binding protein